MQLEATCQTCSRRFALSQILGDSEASGGRCPFCGARFGRHYLSLLGESLEAAQARTDEFVSALRLLAGIHPGFTIDIDSLLAGVRSELSGPEG